MSYYAVARGIETGIFTSPQEYDKYKIGKFSCGKKCATEQEARKYINSIDKALQYEKYAFIDFEFTCSDKIRDFKNRNHIGEVLSVGVVVCDVTGRILEKFYETVKPKYNYKLTPFCINLTKLTQEEIDNSRNLPNVLTSAMKMISKHNVKFIYSFGTSDYLQTKKDIENYSGHALYKRSSKFVNMIRNCQRTIVNRIIGQMTEISLNDCKILLGINGDVEHNALSDAIDLSKIYFKSIYNPPSSKRIADYKEKKEVIYRYKQYRTIKEERIECTESEVNSIVNVCDILKAHGKDIDKIKLKALTDDLLSIVGLEVVDIHEYID